MSAAPVAVPIAEPTRSPAFGDRTALVLSTGTVCRRMRGRDRRPLTLDRRGLLGLLGAGTVVGVAGCLGDGNDGEDGEGDEPRTFEPTIEHPGDGPVPFTDDQHCPVCNMTPGDYSDWNSQVAHENGRGAAFDTPGCMFAYIVAHTADAPISGAWTVGRQSGDLIDATAASFVIVTDETAVDDPMGISPRAFARRDDAVAFLEAYEAEELTEDDIIAFDEIDRETAEIYRGNRM